MRMMQRLILPSCYPRMHIITNVDALNFVYLDEDG